MTAHVWTPVPHLYGKMNHIDRACHNCGRWGHAVVNGVDTRYPTCEDYQDGSRGRAVFAPGGMLYPWADEKVATAPIPAWTVDPYAIALEKPKHRAGLDPEEVDWEAHKAFMRGDG